MDVETLISAISLLVALAAVLIATMQTRRSNRVAAEAKDAAVGANAIASEAVRIQMRIDDRDREYRAVEWSGTCTRGKNDADPLNFELANVGDTDAIGVTVVLKLNPEREKYEFEAIRAGESVFIDSPKLTAWMKEAVEHDIVHPGYHVHWASPLGHANSTDVPMGSLDDYILRPSDDY